MARWKTYWEDFMHLIYPVICPGCGTDEMSDGQLLCAKCLHSLPQTGFFKMKNNPVEQKFYGRVKIENAASAYFYGKDSVIQRLLFSLKYKNDRQCGLYLGSLLANEMANAGWIGHIDMIVPLPLSRERAFQRGYNQASLLALPVSERFGIPLEEHAAVRTVNTETQTHKTREERWNSMQHIFQVTDAEKLRDKHVLVVDDVLTTGATTEVLCSVLLQNPGTKVSIATFACAM